MKKQNDKLVSNTCQHHQRFPQGRDFGQTSLLHKFFPNLRRLTNIFPHLNKLIRENLLFLIYKFLTPFMDLASRNSDHLYTTISLPNAQFNNNILVTPHHTHLLHSRHLGTSHGSLHTSMQYSFHFASRLCIHNL